MKNEQIKEITSRAIEQLIAALNVVEEVAPRARFELATLRLTAECSTIELPGSSWRVRNGRRQRKINRLLPSKV